MLDTLGLPDFATGGKLCNPDETRASLESGQGTVRVAGLCKASEDGEVHVTDYPYGIGNLIEQLEQAKQCGELTGVASIENRFQNAQHQISLALAGPTSPATAVKQLHVLPCMTTEVLVDTTVLQEGRPIRLPVAQLVRHVAEQKLSRHDGSRPAMREELNSLRELAGQRRTQTSTVV